MRHFGFFLLIASFICSACENYSGDGFEQEYVVEAFLIADELLPTLKLFRTTTIDRPFIFEDLAVENARVSFREMDESGTTLVREIPFVMESPGIYRSAVNESYTVKSGVFYELIITNLPDEDKPSQITSRTFVPSAFEILEAGTKTDEEENLFPFRQSQVDTVVYLQPAQFAVKTTLSRHPGRDQSLFVFSIEAQDTNPPFQLTPFFADVVDEEDIPELFIRDSGIVNEGNFDLNNDQTITIRLPWIAIAFFGRNVIFVNAIDDNLFDFLSSRDAQTGGNGTVSPGEIFNILDSIEGGTGVLGSMSRVRFNLVVRRNQFRQ